MRRVHHNTIVGPRPLAHLEGIQVPFLIDRRTLEFRNNIVYATEPQSAALPCSTTRCSHNLYFGMPPAGANAMTSAPWFFARELRGLRRLAVGKGFALQAGSPGIHAGIAMPGMPDHDYFGRPIAPGDVPTLGIHQR